MRKAQFRIVYDGPAVDDGEMDVSQLASSLLALGKLCETADAVITGEASRVRVRVQSDLRRGSFDVGIIVWLDGAWDLAKAWALSSDGAATLSLLSFLGFNVKDGTKGLIQTVRWLAGRRISKKIILRDGNTELHADDGAKLAVPEAVARLADHQQIRHSLEKFTDPLRDDGIEVIRFEPDTGEKEQITAEEAPSFQAAAGSDPTSTARFEATYQVKRLHFEPGKKWRLSSGSQAILAQIEDQRFWERINSSEESFSANDYLVCEVRMDQWLGPTGLKSEYAVERVVEHIPAPEQRRMFD